MIAITALALLGLNAPAEPWLNTLLGSSKESYSTILKSEGEAEFPYWKSKDDKFIFYFTGEPTELVWAITLEESEGDQLPAMTSILDGLGFDSKAAKIHQWDRGEYETPLIESLPGLKKGWTALAGEVDVLFVGPTLSGDFNQMGVGPSPEQAPKAFSAFLKDLTWKGAINAYGKAQLVSIMDQIDFTLTWKGQGIFRDITVEMDLSDGEKALSAKEMRQSKDNVLMITYQFQDDVKDWKTAFDAIGLNSEGVTVETKEDDPGFADFRNVKGLPKGWTVFAYYYEGEMFNLSIMCPPLEGDGQARTRFSR